MQPRQNIIATRHEHQPARTKGPQSQAHHSSQTVLATNTLEPATPPSSWPNLPTNFGIVAWQFRWRSNISLDHLRTKTHETQALSTSSPHIFKRQRNRANPLPFKRSVRRFAVIPSPARFDSVTANRASRLHAANPALTPPQASLHSD